jgi:hypothetical protein
MEQQTATIPGKEKEATSRQADRRSSSDAPGEAAQAKEEERR